MTFFFYYLPTVLTVRASGPLILPKYVPTNILPPPKIETRSCIRTFVRCVPGGSEAQESLQKFTDFLESEASRGRISRELEKRILGKSWNKKFDATRFC